MEAVCKEATCYHRKQPSHEPSDTVPMLRSPPRPHSAKLFKTKAASSCCAFAILSCAIFSLYKTKAESGDAKAEARNCPGLINHATALFVHPALPLKVIEG